uniref:Uncharacterized protein n=1 Tax=Panagrolaimus sp. PS1159 TaxID=55785 RepID=A0AC35FMA4_9BILA
MASSVAPAMYNGCVENLKLIGQDISFNDFLFFAPNVQFIYLEESQVVYQNGVEVPYEVILANLPTVDILYFQRENQFYDFSNTVKELLKIPRFKNLYFFCCTGLNESFDIGTFFEYLKKSNQTIVALAFTGTISEEYKEKLARIVDEILDADSPRTYAPPFIGYNGQLRVKQRAILNLYYSFL